VELLDFLVETLALLVEPLQLLGPVLVEGALPLPDRFQPL